MLLLVDKKHCDNVYEREDLKITLKIFLEKFNYDYVRDAVCKILIFLEMDFNKGFSEKRKNTYF